MTGKPPVIGIIGGTFSGNRGAESMLVSSIGRMREMTPGAHFVVYSYYPKQDRDLVQQSDIEILSCKPAALVLRFFPFALAEWFARKLGGHLPDRFSTHVIRSLSKCDVLLDIGGVSFVDGRERFLPFNILTILPAMLLGVPVVKLAQAMGSFKNPFNRVAAKIFLPRCTKIFARGEITLRQLNELGLKNVDRAADIAFCYKPDDSLSTENEDLVEVLEAKIDNFQTEGKTVIAISPSSLVYGKSPAYLGQLRQMVQDLAGKDVRFVMLANSNRQSSEKARNNDLVVLRALQDEIKRELAVETYSGIEWAIWDSNTQSQRRLIGKCNVLITSRFHAMVSGLALGIPVMVIGWSHKYQEVLADFELEEFALDYERTGVKLSEMALSMLKNQAQLKEKINHALPGVVNRSLAQFIYLKEMFG